MTREPQAGWFVEVPAELKKEFKRLYKGRAAMRKLTIAAIEWALREHPNISPRSNDGTPSAVQSTDSTGSEMHTQANEGRTVQHSPTGLLEDSECSGTGVSEGQDILDAHA